MHQQRWRHSCPPSQLKAWKIFVSEVSAANTMDSLAIPLLALGIKKEFNVRSPSKCFKRSYSVMRTEVRYESHLHVSAGENANAHGHQTGCKTGWSINCLCHSSRTTSCQRSL